MKPVAPLTVRDVAPALITYVLITFGIIGVWWLHHADDFFKYSQATQFNEIGQNPGIIRFGTDGGKTAAHSSSAGADPVDLRWSSAQ